MTIHLDAFRKMPLAAVLVPLILLCACNDSGDDTGNASASGGSHFIPRGDSSTVPMPTLTGPVEGGLRGKPWGAAELALSPLEEFGYVQEEYFFSGTATGMTRAGEPDGTTANYTTRMLTARPASPENFNGTVLVEWLNVTGQIEMDVIWAMAHAELLREGYAYVAMSVQQVGVQASPLSLKFWDPIRYAPLSHPGDAYAFDIFAQGTKALFSQGEIRPMGNLEIERVIAAGESQSAALLIPYINNVDPQHRLFDGYFVHTYPGVVRDDVSVPVLMLLTDTEVEGMTSPLGFAAQTPEQFQRIFATLPGALSLLAIPTPVTAPADFENFRVWEIAGASHYDRQALVYVSAQASRDLIGFPTYDGLPLGCAGAVLLYPRIEQLPLPLDLGRINQLGMQRPTRAALHALNEWMTHGTAPAIQPRINRNEDGSVARDEEGLATGGIRMPVMEVPLGVNEGKSCIFFGRYAEFPDVVSRYLSQTDYLQKFTAAAEYAVDQGVLLPPEAQAYILEAEEESADIWQ